MPYKDKKDYDKFISNKYIATMSIRIPREQQEFYEAMTRASKKLSISAPEFMRISAKEKLIRDGYLSDKPD